MGRTYLNYTVLSEDWDSVVEMLSGRNAFVSSPQNGQIVVYDEKSDAQEDDEFPPLAKSLSERLAAPVFVILNADDDVLCYWLIEHGECVDEYDSAPDYFDEELEADFEPPSVGNPERLCAAFDCKFPEKVKAILTRMTIVDGDFFPASARHEELAELLGLPEYSVGLGYDHIDPEEVGDDFPEVTFTKLSRV